MHTACVRIASYGNSNCCFKAIVRDLFSNHFSIRVGFGSSTRICFFLVYNTLCLALPAITHGNKQKLNSHPVIVLSLGKSSQKRTEWIDILEFPKGTKRIEKPVFKYHLTNRKCLIF